jgi:hypothetical protein
MKIKWPLDYLSFDIAFIFYIAVEIMGASIKWWIALPLLLFILFASNVEFVKVSQKDGWDKLKNKTFVDDLQNPNSSAMLFYEENEEKKFKFGKRK